MGFRISSIRKSNNTLSDDFDSLDIKPENNFFEHEKFFSCLKEDNISEEEYENVKKKLIF